MLQWRNAAGFRIAWGTSGLVALTPNHEALTRAPIAEDLRVLDHAAATPRCAIWRMARPPWNVWDACQIPDYRRLAPAPMPNL